MVAVETPPSHVLEELWDNGDWTDLQIATPTKTFNVHKNIVCTVCPFFKAACARDWKEGRTGVISLPENETVVYCLLRYMYGMHCDVCDEYGLSYDEEIMCIFEARTAADKYGLLGLHALCQEQMIYKIGLMDDARELVHLAIWFYEPPRRQVTPSIILRKIVAELAFTVHYVMRENGGEAWNDLAKQPELLRDVVLQLSKIQPNQVYEADEDLTAGYLRDPKSK